MIFAKIAASNWEAEAELHQRTVYVDIDGTLMRWAGNKLGNGMPQIDAELLAKLDMLRAKGVQVVLWTGQGKQYADYVVERFGIRNHFDAVLAKPHVILDDAPDWFENTLYAIVEGQTT